MAALPSTPFPMSCSLFGDIKPNNAAQLVFEMHCLMRSWNTMVNMHMRHRTMSTIIKVMVSLLMPP